MKKASRLRLRRVALGLTLADVAKALGAAGAKPANVSALHEWETGIRPVPTAIRPMLARVLRCRRLPS